MAPKPEEKIKINSALELPPHFQSIKNALSEPETEDSWQRLNKTLARLESLTKGGAYKYDEFIRFLKDKEVCDPIINSLLSERTSLSGTCSDLIQSIAPRLSDRFESLIPIYIPPLLTICSRTNKVALKRSEKTLLLISKHCKLPSLIPYFLNSSKDKKAIFSLRTISIDCTVTLLASDLGNDRFDTKGKGGDKVVMIEEMIKITATDSNSEVRSRSKELFREYVERWPERVEKFTTPFTPTIRRYLSLPKTGGYRPPNATSSNPISELPTSKSTSHLRDAQMTESELMVKSKRALPDHKQESTTAAPTSRIREHIQEMRNKTRVEAGMDGDRGERREREFSNSNNNGSLKNSLNTSTSTSSRNDTFFSTGNHTNGNHSQHLFSNTSRHPQQHQALPKSSTISQPQNDIFKQFAGGFAKKDHFGKSTSSKLPPPPTISEELNLLPKGPEDRKSHHQKLKREELKREELKRSASTGELKDQEVLSREENGKVGGNHHHSQVSGNDFKERDRQRERESQTERITVKNFELNSSTNDEPTFKLQVDNQKEEVDSDRHHKKSSKTSVNPSEKIAMRLASASSTSALGAVRQRTESINDSEEENGFGRNVNVDLMKTPGLKASRVQLKVNDNNTTLKKTAAGRVLSKEAPVAQPTFKKQNASSGGGKLESLVLIPESSIQELTKSAPPTVHSNIEIAEIEKSTESRANDSADSTPSGSPKPLNKVESKIDILGNVDDQDSKAKDEIPVKEVVESKSNEKKEDKVSGKPISIKSNPTTTSLASKKALKDEKSSVKNVGVKPSSVKTGFVPTTRKVPPNSTSSTITNAANKAKSTTASSSTSSTTAVKPSTTKQPLKASTNQIPSKPSSTLSKSTSSKEVKPESVVVKPQSTVIPKERPPLHAPKASSVRSKVVSSSSTTDRATTGAFIPKSSKITSSISNRNLGSKNLALGNTKSKNDLVATSLKKAELKGKGRSVNEKKILEKEEFGTGSNLVVNRATTSTSGSQLKKNAAEKSKVVKKGGPSTKVSEMNFANKKKVQESASQVKKNEDLSAPEEQISEKKVEPVEAPEQVQASSEENKNPQEISTVSKESTEPSESNEQQDQVTELSTPDQDVQSVQVPNIEVEDQQVVPDSVQDQQVESKATSSSPSPPRSSSSASSQRPKAMRVLSSDVQESEDEEETKNGAATDEQPETEAREETKAEIQTIEEALPVESSAEKEGEGLVAEEETSEEAQDPIETEAKVEESVPIQEVVEDETPQVQEQIVLLEEPKSASESLNLPIETAQEADESLETVKDQDESIALSSKAIDQESEPQAEDVVPSESQTEDPETPVKVMEQSQSEEIEEVQQPDFEEMDSVTTPTKAASSSRTSTTPASDLPSREKFFISRNRKEGGKIQLVCGPRPSETYSDSAMTDTDEVPTSPIRGDEAVRGFEYGIEDQAEAETAGEVPEEEIESEQEKEVADQQQQSKDDEPLKVEESKAELTQEQVQQSEPEVEAEADASLSQPKILLRREENRSSRLSVASSLGDESSVFEDDSVLMV